MPKRKEPALNNPVAKSIFSELDEYATMKQFYPVQNALFSYMTKPQTITIDRKVVTLPARYPDLSQGTFDYWFERLVEDGHIEVDKGSRAVRCVHLVIVEKSSSPSD